MAENILSMQYIDSPPNRNNMLGGVYCLDNNLHKQFVCFFNRASFFYCSSSNRSHKTAGLSGMNRTYGYASHTRYAFAFIRNLEILCRDGTCRTFQCTLPTRWHCNQYERVTLKRNIFIVDIWNGQINRVNLRPCLRNCICDFFCSTSWAEYNLIIIHDNPPLM